MQIMRTILRSAAVALLASVSLSAQGSDLARLSVRRTRDVKPEHSAPAPRLPDGKPDLSGVWNASLGFVRDLGNGLMEPVPFQRWARADYDVRAPGAKWREEPDVNC